MGALNPRKVRGEPERACRPTNGFGELPLAVKELCWKQQFNGDRVVLRIGKLDAENLYDRNYWQSDSKFFMNQAFSAFPVRALPQSGLGLNLTAASHVIHFDRWWNPAVENQATDRAFRIGQTRNVLVHKFICRGTVEDKIDQLIESKEQLAGDLLGGGADVVLTEMKDEELLKLVALDLSVATREG